MELCIYDEKTNKFIYGTNKREDLDKPNYKTIENFFRLITGNHIVPKDGIHQAIGLKDINGKKIYADCSIVEFKDGACRPHCDFGVIRFNSLIEPYIESYEIDVDGKPTDKVFIQKIDQNIDMDSFKIIDTIQENKLGLIRKKI